jgi:NADH dehydrogenase
MATIPERTHRVVILGGGQAGLAAASRLLRRRRAHDRIEVTVVSRDTVLTWHGLIPQIVSAMLQPADAVLPLRKALPGVRLYPYEVEAVDLAARRVRLRREAERAPLDLPYDHLVVTLGSSTDLAHLPGVAEHALEARTIGDAFHLRNHLIDTLEQAAVEEDPPTRGQLLTFVVAGSGFAGVELCSELNGLVRDALRFYPSIDAAEVRVILVTRAGRILGALAPGLSERALRHLRRTGVDVRLRTGLASASPTEATLAGGERIPTRTLVAAFSVGASPVAAALPVRFRGGRIECDEHGRVAAWQGVYAAGDAAAIPAAPAA